MWSIAHAQGIKLPTRDYWEFRDLITVHPRRPKSFDGYLQLFHWTELIQSSPIAVERAVYEVIGGAYRKNNITTLELRFNPMKRNRGGEQDLDHIIAAAVRGMDRATLEYPVKPGPAVLPRPCVPVSSSTRSSRRRRSPGATAAWSASTSPARSPPPSASPTTGGSSAAPASTASGSPSTPASRARSRRSPASSSCSSRTASATASRPPTTRGRWRCSASGGSCSRSAPRRTSTPRSCPAGRSSAGSSTSSTATASATRSPPTGPRCSRPTSATSWRRSAGWASCRSRSSSRSPPRRSRPRSCPTCPTCRVASREPARREVVEREEALTPCTRPGRGGSCFGRAVPAGSGRGVTRVTRYEQQRSPLAMWHSRTTSVPSRSRNSSSSDRHAAGLARAPRRAPRSCAGPAGCRHGSSRISAR